MTHLEKFKCNSKIFTVIPAGSYYFRACHREERSGGEVEEDRKEG